MKKIVMLFLMLALMFSSATLTTEVWAQIWKKQASEEAIAAQRVQIAQQTDAALQSKEWLVYLTPQEDTKGRRKVAVETDILTFSAGKIKSKNLSEQGYKPSNYTLGITETGSAVFETMQTNENGDVVFIKAEYSNGALGGVISMRPKKGDRKSYLFSNIEP